MIEGFYLIHKRLAKLEELRGKHDQVIRTHAIALLMHGKGDKSLNVTNNFLEYCIKQVQDEMHAFKRDLEDEE